MPANIITSFPGRVLDQILIKAISGNELVSQGHIRIEPTTEDEFIIPRIKTGTMLQKRVEMPSDSDSKGDFNLDEKKIILHDAMAYAEFNPRAFEKYWRKYQPQGPLVFAKLNSAAQMELLNAFIAQLNFDLGGEFINGENGAAANQIFDGFIIAAKNDTDIISVTGAALTKSNILDEYKKVLDAIPEILRGHPDLKIFTSVKDFDIYDEALDALPNKGANYTDVNTKRYKGINLVTLSQWPKDVVIATIANSKQWRKIFLQNVNESRR